MKKNLIYVLVVVMIMAMFAGCNTEAEEASSGGTENATGSTEEALLVGVSINTYNNFHACFYEAIEEYAAENNIELKMIDAEGNPTKQVSDIENLLAMEPDAMIVLPADPHAVNVSIDAINEAGIPLVESSTSTENPNYDVFVGADDYAIGVCQGNYIASYLDANPDENLKVGYLHIIPGSTLNKLRMDGLTDTLKSYIDEGRFEIIADADGAENRDMATSMSITEDWLLAYPEMNCIVAQNDGTAVYAVQALESEGVQDDFLVCGADAEDPAVAKILEGSMDMTVLLGPAVWGRTCIEVAVGLINGETYEKDIRIDPIPVTIENADRVSGYKLED